jgi:hypothetical protein
MGNDGRDPRAHGASRPAEGRAGEDLFDVPPTVVDLNAGRRAAAAIAARGFGTQETPTREGKDVVSRLAAHERSLARQRGAVVPDPVLAARPTPRVFDLQRDALEEVQGSGELRFAPIEHAGPSSSLAADQFDIPLGTSAGPSPLAPKRSRAFPLILGTVLALAILGGLGFLGLERGWLPRGAAHPPVSASPGR